MRVFASDRRDAGLLVGVGVHLALWAVALASLSRGLPVSRLLPIGLLLGLALNWTSNTVSHIHLHTPLFTAPWANGLLSGILSLLTGIPQSFWKVRHLRHHGLFEATEVARVQGPWRKAAVEGLAVALLWGGAIGLGLTPALLGVELPALLLGLGLCYTQGWQEHAASMDGVDTRTRWYNALWFNDGYHAAHHRSPMTHWTRLPDLGRPDDVQSPWPPVLRWLDTLASWRARKLADLIDRLEHASLRAPRLLEHVLGRHRHAWEEILDADTRAAIRSVRIVGGGLFPRTALILKDLLPHATLELLDLESRHLEQARQVLDRLASPEARARFRFVAGTLAEGDERPAVDLLVVPLAFRGSREALYAAPPARFVAIHDWMWRAKGPLRSTRVAWWLFKRINLLARESVPSARLQCVQAPPSQTQSVSAGA